MKGEFVGADGQTYHIDSIALKEVCSEPSTTISGSLDGGERLVWKLHLHPSHRDFPAAVAALQALIRPSLDPRAGRALAMREVGWEPGFVCSPDMPNGEVSLSPVWRMRFYGDGGWDLMRMRPSGTWAPTDECGPSIVLLAFEAGRRYERERG